MDSDSNQVQGMGLSQVATGQSGSSMGGQGGTFGPPIAGPRAGATPQASPQGTASGLRPQVIASAQEVPDDASADELDEEWVNKAKEIVDRTKGDPFVESNELNKVKATYLKARYDKHLNVAEGKP